MIREQINAEMIRQGLSILALSRKSGVSYQQLHPFIRGKKGLCIKNLDKVRKALNISD